MRNREEKKLNQLLLHDQDFLNQGFSSLAGVDEAGRGPWAGPVVASAVIVRDFSFLNRVDDSKKMTAASRESAFTEIMAKCEVGVGVIDAGVIDEVNILQATWQAMRQALDGLTAKPDCVLVDGPWTPELPWKRIPVVDGDAKSFSIACASVIAKVTRDRLMETYDEVYPHYGFKRHKGYGTPEHASALEKYGVCAIHRKSFAPIKKIIRAWKLS